MITTTLKGQAYRITRGTTSGIACATHAAEYQAKGSSYKLTELDGVELCDYEEMTERAAVCCKCGVALI